MKHQAIVGLVVAAALSIPQELELHADYADTYLSEEIQDTCIKYGDEYGICPELLMAIVETESSGHLKAENGSCKGLMQINVKWHKDRMERLGVEDIFDMDGNIHVGTDYLSELTEEYCDVGLVLDLYNGNSKAFEYAESGKCSSYVKKVLKRSEELERKHEK